MRPNNARCIVGVNANRIVGRDNFPGMADQGMAERLIQAREAQGRFDGPTEAARALHVSPPTYLGHENGSRGFRASAARYAAFYGVQLAWLLTGKGSMKGHPAQTIYDQLPPSRQTEALRYLKFLQDQ